jgi:fatty-acid desaturase
VDSIRVEEVARSIRDGDPHSPRDGVYWAHMGWIMAGRGFHHDSSVLAHMWGAHRFKTRNDSTNN